MEHNSRIPILKDLMINVTIISLDELTILLTTNTAIIPMKKLNPREAG